MRVGVFVGVNVGVFVNVGVVVNVGEFVGVSVGVVVKPWVVGCCAGQHTSRVEECGRAGTGEGDDVAEVFSDECHDLLLPLSSYSLEIIVSQSPRVVGDAAEVAVGLSKARAFAKFKLRYAAKCRCRA